MPPKATGREAAVRLPLSHGLRIEPAIYLESPTRPGGRRWCLLTSRTRTQRMVAVLGLLADLGLMVPILFNILADHN